MSKISSYNLFNYLFPGALFVVLLKQLTVFSLEQEDIVLSVFFYYFIGLVISRLGSILIEPLLKALRFVKFAEYSNYVAASKVDELIVILSEQNNMYRTLCSVMLCLGAAKLWEVYEADLPWVSENLESMVIIGLGGLFVLAYRKQTAYISSRVDRHTNSRK
ncbi:hypothetical protein OPW04_06560 [Vibrio europaeus]|uniref:hypothetical protein n=2 Tax=Vibrionaceae TaxID=641 RepID=UPI00233E9296|nr:hypothetical protein [Vibrio europaeus]MDC5804499.1 hypothetical protein [Vibrio europaeus]MDC5829540.1 hypothetical protein [Vibrio europaeus]MDC5836042.1 hypothetical protein [Vibrio europaeus]